MLGAVLFLASLASATSTFCGFEDQCGWRYNLTRLVTGQEVNNSWVPGDSALQGPFADVENNTNGHFLYLYLKQPGPKEVHVWSDPFVKSSEHCRLTFWLHMHNMSDGALKVVINSINYTQWYVGEKPGNDDKRWQNYSIKIGGIKQKFSIILEFTLGNKYPLHVALDNIMMQNCLPDPPHNICSSSQFQCSDSSCIDSTKVCNIVKDCENGEDEEQECDKVPAFARCSFEDGWCGWHNGVQNDLASSMNWTINNGSTPTSSTGPSADHTFRNETGMYIYVEMSGKHYHMGTVANLESPIINPPPRYHNNISSPYYNSCYISFYYHKHGTASGSLGLFLIELQENANRTNKIWWSYGEKGNKWQRQVIRLPRITNRYYLQFEARRSFSSRGDPAIDDISMSPKCFGIGVPKEHLPNENITNLNQGSIIPPPPVTHQHFYNSTIYHFTTCGATGRTGPSPEQCLEAYNNSDVKVTVIPKKPMMGIQEWIVPESNYYTIIARGASGGLGSGNIGYSRGSHVRSVVELHKGTRIYILVGQEGTKACLK